MLAALVTSGCSMSARAPKTRRHTVRGPVPSRRNPRRRSPLQHLPHRDRRGVVRHRRADKPSTFRRLGPAVRCASVDASSVGGRSFAQFGCRLVADPLSRRARGEDAPRAPSRRPQSCSRTVPPERDRARRVRRASNERHRASLCRRMHRRACARVGTLASALTSTAARATPTRVPVASASTSGGDDASAAFDDSHRERVRLAYRAALKRAAVPDPCARRCARAVAHGFRRERWRRARRMSSGGREVAVERRLAGWDDDYRAVLERAYGVRGRMRHMMRSCDIECAEGLREDETGDESLSCRRRRETGGRTRRRFVSRL